MSLVNLDMEAAVLGTILNNNDLFYKVIDLLSEESFAEGLHRDIYSCTKKLLEEGEQISPFRLYNRFAEVLGEDNKGYVASLCALSSPISLRSDAKHLADLSHRRAISSICSVALDELGSFDNTGMEQVAELITQATKIITGMNTNNSIGILSAIDNLLQQMKADKPVYQAKTGLKTVDKGTDGGFQKGRVYAFMAAAKVGKTMMATTISNKLNDNGHKHVFVCAEMGSHEIVQRMIGQRLNVPTNAFLTKDPVVIKGLEDVMCSIKRNVIFEDAPGIELEYLKSIIELHVHKNKIEGFILDYYQLVSGCKKNETQAQHLENVANWVHRVCKKHSIWCVLLVQTNDEQKVLGSRGLSRACDQGYLIERPLDSQGDPIGSVAWLKLRFSRYTRTYNFGSESEPCLQVSQNGTHFNEIIQSAVNHYE